MHNWMRREICLHIVYTLCTDNYKNSIISHMLTPQIWSKYIYSHANSVLLSIHNVSRKLAFCFNARLHNGTTQCASHWIGYVWCKPSFRLHWMDLFYVHFAGKWYGSWKCRPTKLGCNRVRHYSLVTHVPGVQGLLTPCNICQQSRHNMHSHCAVTAMHDWMVGPEMLFSCSQMLKMYEFWTIQHNWNF